jgi:hypothetical protein
MAGGRRAARLVDRDVHHLPNTTVQEPNTLRRGQHALQQPPASAATRGGRDLALGSRSRPDGVELRDVGREVGGVALTCSSSGSGDRQTTNSPVASTLRRLSLDADAGELHDGGSTPAMVKNECGARLSTPSTERLDTQAIGRGTTTLFSSG